MSEYIYELTSWLGDRPTAATWVREHLVPAFPSDARSDVDLFEPVVCSYGDPGPDIIVYIRFSDPNHAVQVLENKQLKEVLAQGIDARQLRGDFMRVHNFPIGSAPASPVVAPFSFVVRYYLPAKDIGEFQSYYMKMHPPILAEFEGIRNIMCYTPEALACAAYIPRNNYLIGNEVVFDSVDDFERALKSPVAAKSKADTKTFPPYSMKNPHFAMNRTRVISANSCAQ